MKHEGGERQTCSWDMTMKYGTTSAKVPLLIGIAWYCIPFRNHVPAYIPSTSCDFGSLEHTHPSKCDLDAVMMHRTVSFLFFRYSRMGVDLGRRSAEKKPHSRTSLDRRTEILTHPPAKDHEDLPNARPWWSWCKPWWHHLELHCQWEIAR